MLLIPCAATMMLLPPPHVNEAWEHVVVSATSDFEACGVADFDHDGDLDIACGDTWYEAPDWTPRPIGLVRSIGGYRVDFADVPMDIDQDGLMDIVSCSWHDRGIFWRRNPGNKQDQWKMKVLDTPGHMETAIAVDVDGDGTLDFLPNIIGRTVWYQPKVGGMITHVVSTARALKATKTHLVVSEDHGGLKSAIEDQGDLNWVVQTEQLGTGHAVQQASPFINADAALAAFWLCCSFESDTTLVSFSAWDMFVAWAPLDVSVSSLRSVDTFELSTSNVPSLT